MPGASRDLLGELINRLTGRGRESVRARWCAFRGNEGNDSRFITAREIHGFGRARAPKAFLRRDLFSPGEETEEAFGLMASTRSWRRNSFNSDLPAIRDRSFTGRIPFRSLAARHNFDTAPPSRHRIFFSSKRIEFTILLHRIVVTSFLSFPRIYLICEIYGREGGLNIRKYLIQRGYVHFEYNVSR